MKKRFDFGSFESFIDVFGTHLGGHLWNKFGSHKWGLGKTSRAVVFSDFHENLSGDSKKMLLDYNR